MKKICGLFFFFISSICFSAVDNQQGQEKSAVCAACHGQNGISTNAQWPNLAGQHSTYLIKQLKDFKSGTLRSSSVMAPFVAGLNDEDIASLALYYSKQTLPIVKNEEGMQRGMQLYRGGRS